MFFARTPSRILRMVNICEVDCHSWGISTMQSGRQDTLEERYAINFFFNLVKNATETYGMLQTAFRLSCMNQASVLEWHKRFKEGRESMRDNERCGRSREVRAPELIGQIKNIMDKDHRVCIETISAKCKCQCGNCTYNYSGTEDAEDFAQGCAEKIRKKDVVMTAGRRSS